MAAPLACDTAATPETPATVDALAAVAPAAAMPPPTHSHTPACAADPTPEVAIMMAVNLKKLRNFASL